MLLLTAEHEDTEQGTCGIDFLNFGSFFEEIQIQFRMSSVRFEKKQFSSDIIVIYDLCDS